MTRAPRQGGEGGHGRAPLHSFAFLRQVQAVTNPGFSQQVLGVGRVRLYFLTKLIDEDAKVFNLFAIIGPPHRLKEPRVGYNNV